MSTLCSLDREKEALNYVDAFCFNLCIRLYAVELLRTRSSRSTLGMDEDIIEKANDYNKCLELISLTHPKVINKNNDMEVKYVEIPKKDSTKVRVLGLSNISDRVLQLQFLILLDPIIEVGLSEFFYGFRKGRSSLHAIAYLSKSIQLSDLSRYHLVSLDIHKCFDSIDQDFILENFPFPQKQKCLLKR